MSHNLLLLSTNGEATKPFVQLLSQAQTVVHEVRSFDEAEQNLLARDYHILVARYDTMTDNFRRMLDFIQQHELPTRVILLSKSSSIQDAVEALKAGAYDFIVSKTLDAQTVEALRQSISTAGLNGSVKNEEEKSSGKKVETILVGKSKAISEVRSAVGLVAKSDTPVLITGESGTGKEVVARLIHLQSGRANQPFIALNCAAIPRDVIENELFGHEKGAFTGALIKKAGSFELANGGTLFFDEIAEMNPETQAKLLRAIETKCFRRLGGKDEITVDVRTIAATNKNMTEALKTKEFREDLYYRFSVIEIEMPPLRERREDIPILVEHFMTTCKTLYKKPKQRFAEKTLEMLNAYDWPGNVRELRNIIERCVVTCPEMVISPRYLPDRVTSAKHLGTTLSMTIGTPLKDVEQKFIIQTIAACGNNKTRAAQVLGLSRKTLHNKLRRIKV